METARLDVAILLGSDTDKPAFENSKMTDILDACGVSYEVSTLSGDRNDEELGPFCQQKLEEGVKVFIAIAGLINVLGGAVEAKIKWTRPVLAVGLGGETLGGLASLFSITFKPRGTPVAGMGMDKHGLCNAAWFAAQIVALTDAGVARRFDDAVNANLPPVRIGWLKSRQRQEGA